MKSLLRFALPSVLGACVFALLCVASIAQASPRPSAEHDGHFCKVLDYEDLRARDSLYAARKQAQNLNVGEPRTVRMIYFLPNDRPFRREVVDSMKTTIRQIQTFFRDQMRARGHGALTFRFETDAQGDPLVHRLDGQYPDSHYIDDTLNAFDEVGMAFDLSANVYLIVVDNSIDAIALGGFVVAGVGSGQRSGGSALVPGGFHWTVAAHELGHAFRLGHDFNNNAYLMSYGDRRSQLSTCHAEYLSVHPFFNADIPDVETPPPTIELISSPLYPAGARSVSIQCRVGTPNGLHQVILAVEEISLGEGGLKTWRALNGERDAVVQFDYDGVIPANRNSSLLNPDKQRIYVVVIDILGYMAWTDFELSCATCPITLTKIAGDNQQGTPGETLTNPLVVAVGDKNGGGLAGLPIKFAVTAGEGKLGGRFTTENATTDANGRARSTLTLGPNSGANTIEAAVAITELRVTFNALGIGTPTTPITASNYQTWHLPDGAMARLGKGDLSRSDRAVAFSPDGQRFAVASGIGVWLYDAATARELALLTGHLNRATSVAFSPDGTILVAGSREEVKLWDVATRRPIATLTGHTNQVNSVSFSPDGRTLASGSWDGTVRLWDVTTRQTIATLAGHTDHVNSISFSPDSRTLASGSGDGTVKLWDVATRRTIATLAGHTDHVNSVSFSPDRTILAAGSGGEVKLWDVTTRRAIATLAGYTSNVNSVSFSPDGTTLAAGSWGEVKLWDVTTRRAIATLAGAGSAVSFSPDGRTLAAGSGGEVKLWDTNTQNNVTRSHTSHVNSVAFSPDGTTLASGSGDGTVKLWDVTTRRTIATLAGHTSVNSVSFSPDGRTLASGSWEDVKLWEMATRRAIATLAGAGSSVSFSPDSKTLAAGSWEEVKLWDVTTSQPIATLTGHANQVNSISFSPDGRTLAAGSEDRTVRLWDVTTRRAIATLSGHTNPVNSVSFSPDGRTLASSSWDGTVRLWDVATRRTIATLAGAGASVSFSPDGRTLASDSWDGVKLWDVATRRTIATLTGHTSNVNSVSFSPDGRTLVSGAEDGTVLLWDMSPYVTSITPPTPTPDFNGDGQVNFPDFLLFATKYGLRRGDANYDARFDLDGDGTIGFGDFLIFARAFGREGS